jgi:hypothetical protein
MKKLFVVVALLNLLTVVYGDDIILSMEVEDKAAHGMSYKADKTTPVRSFFDNAQVINISEDAKNTRNLGVYVETVVHLKYNYKGKVLDEEIYAIFSNLSKINVRVGQTVNTDTIIGYGGGSGTNIYSNTNLFLYIYSKQFSPFLAGRTKNRFLEAYDAYWWDPLSVIQSSGR